MTTFGVGELSAINAITGSFAEHVAVVHIVGSPSSGTQAAQRIVHHSLGDGVFTHFLDMHAAITCARAALTPETAASEIDRVLATMRDQHLPGCLLLPADVGERPAEPPSAPLPPPTDGTDPDALDAFGRAAEQLLAEAADVSRIGVLGGLIVHRAGATTQFAELVASGPLSHATTLWSKSLVDENNPYYVGNYAGAASDPAVRATVEDADALIIAGVQFTDLTSGFFSHQIDRRRTIELDAALASVGFATFAPVSMSSALQALSAIVSRLRPPPGAQSARTAKPAVADQHPADDGPLDQGALWEAVADFLRPGDSVVADRATSLYGMGQPSPT